MQNGSHINLHDIARQAMIRYGFQFNSKVFARRSESSGRSEVLHRESPRVSDWRDLLWSSIDNADSLDLDQLEYCERGPAVKFR